MPDNIFISKHPLVHHRLAVLRDKNTDTPRFRWQVRQIAQMLFFEAAQDLKTQACTVSTPLAECTGLRLSERLGLVPILRAGLGMAEAILDLVPSAEVWHLGLYRDHRTQQPITYYKKLSQRAELDICFVVDPMLATGGSAVAAINILKEWGLKRIKFMGIIAAPEGVKTLASAHPDVEMYLGAVDSHLNKDCYIVPGLGDAGDRQFGTR